ncbi:hypothetical protein Fmac_017302 [Flemingia macrophylla]|uniref:NB-ARC domain-containing protein n=1 Tax=Flemingia macrophylla TaxID=520843 RepID=A0ABD1M1X0_9FABA
MTNTMHIGFVASEHGVSGGSNDIGRLIRQLNQLEEDIKDQLRLLELRVKKPKNKVHRWLNELKGLKRRAGDMNRLESSQIQTLTEELEKHEANKPVVVSNEFVGEDFEDYVKKIWKLLGDDKVFIIGIHGMGGVGKTFLATYMENEIKRKKAFNHVSWVTVSHDFAVFKLQQQIAERMGVNLYGDDERTRATILASELEKIENSVLILDDVWSYIDIEKVGIPLKMNGIKLIITSRLKHVCQQMDCHIIKMGCLGGNLFYAEVWELFWLKFGYHEFPTEVEEIAKSVIYKCNGLPLAINVMARTMKGKDDIQWWKYAVNKLEYLEMEEETLTVLKRSYDYLTDKVLQKCFLHCALLPEFGGKITWATKVVESGMLSEKKSLKEMIDEGFVIIDKLIQHSLLLDSGLVIQMHGLVRNMACHILNESRSCMVKCHHQLIKIPDMREWTADLKIVSLAGNEIEEIAEGTSPECPSLTTLILSFNRIIHIPESFFTCMNALTLLDLSYNDTLTSLPNSLSNLKSLISLLLRGCSQLRYIPPLGQLQKLSKLDISDCSINQVPLGLENLINLKWLDLFRTFFRLPDQNVLSCLTNMQYLDVRDCSNLKAEDVKRMRMLECFAGCFEGLDNYNNYVRQTLNKDYGPKAYFIIYCDGVYEDEDDCILYKKEFNRRRLEIVENLTELPCLLPRDLEDLRVRENYEWEYLCAALSSKKPPPLKTIQIRYLAELKRLFCLGNGCSTCTFIQSQHIDDFCILNRQTRMEVFRHLKHFEISRCNKIEMLFTPELVSSLQQLKSIEVYGCLSIKEIFGDNPLQVELSNLTKLKLRDLPELHTVCKQDLVCASQNALDIENCPNLKERPRTYLCRSFLYSRKWMLSLQNITN